jgi:hypothetical protein
MKYTENDYLNRPRITSEEKFIDDLIQKEYNDHPRLGVKIGTKPSVEDFGEDLLARFDEDQG